MDMPATQIPEASATASRRRSADEDTPMLSLDTTTPSPDFWFNDGTIVLQAEGTSFRVHAGIISTNSSYFAHLWRDSLTQEGTTAEGWPMVVLSDTALDWENVLKTIYYPMRLQRTPEPLSSSFLASLLRLGKRYDFTLIREFALEELKKQIPGEREVILHWPGIDVSNIKNLFDMVNFSVELNIQTVLPVLYYACIVETPLVHVLDGCPREDGTIATLSPDTKRLLILKQHAIRMGIMNYIWGWLINGISRFGPLTRCQSPQMCTQTKDALKTLISRRITTDLSQAIVKEGRELSNGFCQVCQETNVCEYTAGHARFYDDLPILFDLPVWAELRDFAT